MKNNHYIRVYAKDQNEAMLKADYVLQNYDDFRNVFIIGAIDKEGNFLKTIFGGNIDISLDIIKKDIIKNNKQSLSLKEIEAISDRHAQLLAYRNYYNHEFALYTQLKDRSIEDIDIFNDQIYPYEFTEVGLTSHEIPSKEEQQYIVFVVVED